jgi:hypothetical protein
VVASDLDLCEVLNWQEVLNTRKDMRLRRNSDKLERIHVHSVPRTTDVELNIVWLESKAKRGSMYIKATEVWSPFGFRPILHNSTFLCLSCWDN